MEGDIPDVILDISSATANVWEPSRNPHHTARLSSRAKINKIYYHLDVGRR